MKKTNIKNILKIIKDALTKACIYFTAIIIFMNLLGKFAGNNFFALNILGTLYLYDDFAQAFCFMLALASVFAGFATQIFKIEKLPVISRHIAFFILLYIDFIAILIPFSSYNVSQDSMLLLSVGFTVIYLVAFGITIAIKSIINSVRNKKSAYEKQF